MTQAINGLEALELVTQSKLKFDFIVLDAPGFLDGSPKKEQLFRERRFPCVRVGDNPKGSSAGYFVLNLHGVLFSLANVGFVYVNLMAKPVLT